MTTLLNSVVSYNFTKFEKHNADDENWKFQTRKKWQVLQVKIETTVECISDHLMSVAVRKMLKIFQNGP